MVRRIAVLGSTGSIGTQTLDVARRHPDKVEIVAIAAGKRGAEALAQAAEFGVKHIALGEAAPDLDVPAGMDVAYGADAVAGLVKLPEVDVVVNALVGAAGLQASYETLRAGKVLALANKESLVVGGDLIMPLAARVDEQRRLAGMAPSHGPAGALMPIDSEHGAIYQCLIGEDHREAALRELREETGYTTDTLIDIGPLATSPALLTEIIYCYLAEDMVEGETDPDPDEFLEMVKIPLEDMVDMILRGEIEDAKTQSAVLKVWAMKKKQQS